MDLGSHKARAFIITLSGVNYVKSKKFLENMFDLGHLEFTLTMKSSAPIDQVAVRKFADFAALHRSVCALSDATATATASSRSRSANSRRVLNDKDQARLRQASAAMPAKPLTSFSFSAIAKQKRAMVEFLDVLQVRSFEAKKKEGILSGWVFFLISLGSPHVRPIGRTCGEPNEIELAVADI